MLNNTQKGQSAEDLAEQFLVKKGMRIISRNFHFGKTGEIDLIAQDGATLVFVEVKARWNDNFGAPEESISYSKAQKLRRAAEGYMYVNKIQNRDCRFDFIGIEYKGEPVINHIVNAF